MVATVVVSAASLSVATRSAAAAATSGTAYAYVTSYGSPNGTVTPINLATNMVGTPVTVGSVPEGIAITPNGTAAYVTNLGSGTVTPINVATNIAGTPIAVGSDPTAIAITPNGTTAYVTNLGSGTVTPINVATNTTGTPITLGIGTGTVTAPEFIAEPEGIAITPNGTTAYVTGNYFSPVSELLIGTVTPIDLATNTAGTAITVGSYPEGIAITPNGTTAYVTNNGSDTVTPINVATNIAGTPITVGSDPTAIAITPNGTTAYVTNFSTVTPINVATNTAGTSITLGHSGATAIAITPNGTTAYVVNGFVTPINLATNTLGTPIGSFDTPEGIAITPGSGCTQQKITDGSFQVSGCLDDGSGGVDTTNRQSSIDGVDVSADSDDSVDYATDSDDVTSTGASKISLVLDDQKIAIFDGDLSDSLEGSLSFAVAANTQIAGMTISGTLTLTPKSLGTASGSVSVTLPPALGGGTGTLTFTTSTKGGLSNLSISVPQSNFMQLFSLSDLTLSFSSPGTWSIKGTASSGGSTSTTFSGSMTYDDDTLDSAELGVGGISVAGLFDVSTLVVSYGSGTWSGSAIITQQSGTPVSAAVSMTFAPSTGSLTAASISYTGSIDLFGVLTLSQFAMSYSGTSWGIGWTTPAGAGGSASLTSSNGVITAANATLTNISLLGELTIDTATLSYSQSAPNSACPSVVGTEIWCGSWQVSLPQATVVTGVSGSLAFANGAFASGSVSVSGNVPLLLGVVLTQLGASVRVNPPPTTLTGTGTITFGVPVASVPLFSLQGTVTRVFPTSTAPGEYTVGGTLTALPGTSEALVLGTANITDPDKGATTFTLSLGPSPATGLTFKHLGISVTVTASLSGSFTASTFSITGQSQITVTGKGTLTGSVKADDMGIASCAGSAGSMVGFEYEWSGTVHVFGTKGCSEKGF